THGIAPQAVTQGALVLARSVPYMPVGIHLAVVDPGVGGDRRAVAIRTAGGRVYIGPDNGLLSLAAPAATVEGARALTNARFHLDPVSRTFHARDIFAPAAAHLANGVAIEELGRALEPGSLVRIAVPAPELGRTQIGATVLSVDRFGNVATNVRREHIEALGLADGDRVEIRLTFDRYFAVVAGAFADAPPGELLLYEDSYGLVTLAISRGNAARLTGVSSGDEVRIART
ncbi:MAG: hypothetical protein QOE10_2681, partial [Gaiellales bacterium]|nr:hypothetical protein [Gaiellales bacterium]